MEWVDQQVGSWWHDPFRIKTKVDKNAYELESPDKGGYRLYPVAPLSRLKAVKELATDRDTEVTEETRLDFDEELSPGIVGNLTT